MGASDVDEPAPRPVVDPQAGRLVDFDGDGKPDFLGLGAAGDDMWFIPNTSAPGAPARGQSVPMSTGWKTVTKYWLTDYDGDGKTDVLGLNGTDQMLAWRSKGTAVPSFEQYVSLGTLWSTFSHIPTAQ
ncbi:VCBS repeat-containing protein [Acrocarpospora sp. B8E8]|uniref:FG-GAP repeat domain-containing protein n=1 Tax=Acrocarpospora sp. B8E8 TaxID=3153572 RepID=UPI00325D6556